MSNESENKCICEEHGVDFQGTDYWILLPTQINESVFMEIGNTDNKTTDTWSDANIDKSWFNTGEVEVRIELVPQLRTVCTVCGWVASLDEMIDIVKEEPHEFLDDLSCYIQSWIAEEKPPIIHKVGEDGRLTGWQDWLAEEVAFMKKEKEDASE